MPEKLKWDQDSERLYETGVSQVALYVKGAAGYGKGVAWNGITGITESPSGADITKLYANNGVYANLQAAEEFGGTIEAYTYPDAWAECDGSAVPVAGMKIGQQTRKTFGLAYKTNVGNDTNGNKHGYQLHLVYGCLATPSERAYATINESPEAITFSWEFQTTPVNVAFKDADGNDYNATSIVTIESKDFADEAGKAKLAELEDLIYGSTNADATLPSPDEVYAILNPSSDN